MTEKSDQIDVTDLSKSLQRFGWPDYLVFLIMLTTCALIGVYFGFVEKKIKKKKDRSRPYESEVVSEYLMGGKQMSVVPIALSLVSSWISGISLLGIGSEMYLFGTAFVFIIISQIISGLFIGFVYLPVFYELQLTSMNEYFELRFDKRIRLFASVLYTIATMLYLPLVIYAPALAFSHVTGVNLHIITPLVCVICIFYTLVGGIKAVVWTDTVQTIMMFGAMIVVVVKGTIFLSGIETVWSRNYDGGRLVFPELTFDLTERHSLAALWIGGTIFYVHTCILSQSMTQRYLSLPTMKDARCALVIFVVLLAFLTAICCYSGLLAYALYYDCDPLQTQLINKKDQLVPLLVMEVVGDLPGLPGLFLAGVLSAALSSLSTSLNSMSAVVLEDFYKPFASQPLSEKQTSYLMRLVVLVVGVVSLALVYVAEHLRTVLELSYKLGGVTAGPMFGLFTMGLMCPWVNRRGALIGGLAGILTMIWICVSSEIYPAVLAEKPLTVEGCDYTYEPVPVNANTTIAQSSSDHNESSFPIHHISYMFYTLFGSLITTGVGSIVSLLCEEKIECDMDPLLFVSFVRKFVNPRKLLSVRPDVKEKSCVIHAFETKDTQF